MRRRYNHELFGAAGTPQVVVVGGGFGGIAAGVKLKQAGIDTFTIFERSEAPGGTWWDNHYPGAEVDVASHLYSYSFMDYDWSRTHVRQPELQRYLEDVVDRFGLRPHFRFKTAVRSAVWDDLAHHYTVRLDGGEELTAHVVITALGLLNEPRYPDWPGLEDFAGPKFHTARWEHQHDLAGKTVAVVGTGSTSAQVVPTIAPEVGRLYVFQREPGWVTPKGDRDYTPEERAAFTRPFARRIERTKQFARLEKLQFRGAIHRPGTKANTRLRELNLKYLRAVLKDRPDLVEALTPDYPFPGKRPVITSAYFPALLRENVELVPRAVTRVTSTGVVDSEGVERPVDVLVMATGFQPTNFLASMEVVGRDGRTLHEVWDGEPAAFLGLTVPGFPNFFMLYGPNTNGGEIVHHLEWQADYALRAIRRMVREGVTSVEVRRGASDLYNRWIQRRLRGTAWTESNNYYKTPSGRIVTQWPDGALLYGFLTKILGRLSERTVRRPARGVAEDMSPAPLVDGVTSVNGRQTVVAAARQDGVGMSSSQRNRRPAK